MYIGLGKIGYSFNITLKIIGNEKNSNNNNFIEVIIKTFQFYQVGFNYPDEAVVVVVVVVVLVVVVVVVVVVVAVVALYEKETVTKRFGFICMRIYKIDV